MATNQNNKSPSRFMAEAIEELKHRDLDVTATMLRKCETYGIPYLDSTREKGKYRVYDEKALDIIEIVYLLRFLDYSMKQIKEFIDLEQSIIQNPLIETTREWVEDLGDFRYVRRIRLDADESQVKYRELVVKIKKFRTLCDRVNDGLEKARSLINRGQFLVTNKKVSI